MQCLNPNDPDSNPGSNPKKIDKEIESNPSITIVYSSADLAQKWIVYHKLSTPVEGSVIVPPLEICEN